MVTKAWWPKALPVSRRWKLLSRRLLSLLHYTMSSHTTYRILHSTARMARLYFDFFLQQPLYSVVNLHLIERLTKIKSSDPVEFSLSLLEWSIQSKDEKVSLVLHGSFRSTKISYNQRRSVVPGLFGAIFWKAELLRSHCPQNPLFEQVTSGSCKGRCVHFS